MVKTPKDFILALPQTVPADSIKEIETLFFFDISGEGGGQYSVKVEEGKIEVIEGKVAAPKCEIKAKSKDFMGVLNGDLNPMMAVLMGKVKISNQQELIRHAQVFGLM